MEKNTDSNTNKTKRPFNYAKFWRRAALIAYDTLSVILASFLSLMIRYEFHIGEIPDYFYRPVWEAMPVTIVATLFLFFLFKLYDSLWAFAGETEMQNLVFACIASGVVNILVLHLFRHDYQPVPMSYYFLYIFLLMTLVFVSRFSYRFLRSLKHRSANKDNATNVMLVGAGEAGNIIAREILQSHYSTMNLRCFVDDDTSKWGRYIQGIKVVGGRDQILEAADTYSIDEIIVAIPSISRKELSKILDICKNTSCKLRVLPGIYQLVNGEVSVSKCPGQGDPCDRRRRIDRIGTLPSDRGPRPEAADHPGHL